MEKIFALLILFFVSHANAQAQYNFDVVIQNDGRQIYRSAALGAKGLEYLDRHLKAKGLPFPKTIIYMNSNGYEKGGFAQEEISLQKKYGFVFHHSLGETETYLEGHDPRFPKKDVNHDGIKDGDKEDFYRILGMILDKKNQPVLFHCLGGRHRTGMMAMAIRTLQGGNWVDGPKKRKWVFPRLRSPLLSPLEQEYADHNNELFRLTNVKFIREVSKEERFLEMIGEFRGELN